MFVRLSVRQYTCYPRSANLEKGGLYQIGTVFCCNILSQFKRELLFTPNPNTNIYMESCITFIQRIRATVQSGLKLELLVGGGGGGKGEVSVYIHMFCQQILFKTSQIQKAFVGQNLTRVCGIILQNI